MRRPSACNCRCGCCVPISTDGVDWDSIPQRFQIDTDPWSWTMPSGHTHVEVKYPVTAGFENFFLDTFAKSLDTVGQSNIAWALHSDKYSSSFGAWAPPPMSILTDPFTFNTSSGAFQWTAADHDGLVQLWHDAGVRSPTNPNTYLNSYVGSMLDNSDNASSATPFMSVDVDSALMEESGSNPGFVYDPELYNQTVCTFGSSQRIYIQRLASGQCYWMCLVVIKPRFSMHMSIDPILPYEKTRYVSPAVSRTIGGTAHTNPPYLIASGLGSSFPMQPDIGYSEDNRLRNWGGPLDYSLITSDPPGGWRSWIELAYMSDAPVDCNANIRDMEPFTLSLIEDFSRVSLGPPKPSWSAWLSIMNAAFGLATPPATMTIQRLPDIT